MKNLPLHWKIIIGLVAGIVFALLSSNFGWSQFVIDWINPWGTIFIRLLKLIAVPLILFSIIKGVAGMSRHWQPGKTGIQNTFHLPDNNHFCSYHWFGTGQPCPTG